MAVTKELRSTGRQLLHLSHEEIKRFAGNCLELRTRHEELILVISETAVKSLRNSNLAALQGHLRLIVTNVPTIENVGGGGVRCMLAGIHLGKYFKFKLRKYSDCMWTQLIFSIQVIKKMCQIVLEKNCRPVIKSGQ